MLRLCSGPHDSFCYLQFVSWTVFDVHFILVAFVSLVFCLSGDVGPRQNCTYLCCFGHQTLVNCDTQIL